jgi:putative DNA primase/helicase
VLFRVIAKYHPTLLMDEADTWLLDEKSDLRGIVNAGHSRQGTVYRCVGDDNDVTPFHVFGPKVIAQIGKPAKTILSRSIVISQRRKRADESVTHLRQQDGRRKMAPLRRKWRRWADDNLDDLCKSTPDLPTALINRARDNWEPLLSIAQRVGDVRWSNLAAETALAMSGISVDDDEPVKIRLLADVQRVFNEREEPHLSAQELIDVLNKLPEIE